MYDYISIKYSNGYKTIKTFYFYFKNFCNPGVYKINCNEFEMFYIRKFIIKLSMLCLSIFIIFLQ